MKLYDFKRVEYEAVNKTVNATVNKTGRRYPF